ncbi:MAG: peptidase T [Bacteroidaceae bacterium]|nr:peptidase T [Bacteroidaceae bacterium]MBR1521033.1 peptidase T [Bacteroidaceae bacterium]
MDIVERFLKYVSFDTQSAEDTGVTPSTEKQRVFAKYLKEELIAEGLQDVELDELGYLYATLPANTDKPVPTIGFIAHMDTSPDASGENVRPRIVTHYDGGDIVLSEGIITSPEKFPELLDHKGEDLIVTDGTTLLGADDKAGIAEIVQAMVYLQQHPDIQHGTIRVGFNPDEEIGLGAHHFDVEKFGCEFAYTMDGSEVGEIEFENFNAASAKITINGCSVHPGYAKGKMLNAARIATELVGMLPADETPETTEGYEGFFHLTSISGGCEKAQLSFIIRDHDREYFESRKTEMQDVVAAINEKFGEGVAVLEMNDQYYNMREKLEDKMYIIDIAQAAMTEAGIEPKIKAIRGGTDGAQLSFKGLPCPNLFAGGLNFHGPHEFCPVQSLEKAMQTVVNICSITAERLGK